MKLLPTPSPPSLDQAYAPHSFLGARKTPFFAAISLHLRAMRTFRVYARLEQHMLIDLHVHAPSIIPTMSRRYTLCQLWIACWKKKLQIAGASEP